MCIGAIGTARSRRSCGSPRATASRSRRFPAISRISRRRGFGILPGHSEALEKCRRGPGPHAMSGPIEIAGAEPGDVLEVRVADIQLRQDWGWNLQMPCMGTLPEDFPEKRLIHVALDAAANTGKLPWGQLIPLDPFFGCFGVAPPASWGRLSTKEPRAFGGNMDNKELGVGATIYFPVFVEGALFSAGDGTHCRATAKSA